MNEKSKIRGIPANTIVLPLEIALSILLILIIILVVELNRSNNKLADLLEQSGIYQLEVWNLQAGVNTLSETITTYIQKPVFDDGSPNIGPLIAYVQELDRDRRGPQIADRFRSLNVGSDTQSLLDNAAEISVTMMDIQSHAITLMRSVYPLPPIPELSALPDSPLNDEELSLPEEGRTGLARKLILDQDYVQMKYFVAEDISTCNNIFAQEFSRLTLETKQHVKILRTVLWCVIFSIVIILFFIFIVIRFWLVKPLRDHSREISSDKDMKQTSRILEMQVLVNAYNALLNRRNKLESILRSAAETDTLTGLPNRYSMKRYELEADEESGSIAVIVFDINFLKQVNDRQGHLAGDQLIRTTGECIRESFDNGNNNCYRLGGDEFAAVLRNCSEESVTARIEHFRASLKRESISVSVGYAFTENIDKRSFKELFDEADRCMYENKKQIHESKQDNSTD